MPGIRPEFAIVSALFPISDCFGDNVMLRRTQTYGLLMVLFIVTGMYSFWLYFQWTSIGGDPGVDPDVVRRNALAALFVGLICAGGCVALTIAHFKKLRRDI